MKRLFKTYLEKLELAGLILLVLLVIVFQVRSHGVFLNADNLRGILGILPEAGLVAIGVTILMISGEFDLSVGSVFALMPMTMAVLMVHGAPFPLALLAGLLVCAAVGFINGYITIRFAIPSFITTLGMLSFLAVSRPCCPPTCRPGCSPRSSARETCSACRSCGSPAPPC